MKSYVSIVFTVMLTCLLCKNSGAQNTEKTELSKLNLYTDFGFHFAGQASINIESQIYSGEKVTWYGRIGAGFVGIIMANGGPGGLGAITLLTGKQKDHFETNGGVFIFNGDHGVSAVPLLDFGYRHQKPQGGFIFKAKLGILGIGIGLGYAF